MAESIPSPRGYPIIGNALDIDAEFPMLSLSNLANRYGKYNCMGFRSRWNQTHNGNLGEIFKLRLGGHERIFICRRELFNELMDEKRFEKAITGALIHVRSAVHDGLFTALPGEHNWGVAHRALMPAFGPISIRDMYDGACPLLS